jgi:hypothetical protein
MASISIACSRPPTGFSCPLLPIQKTTYYTSKSYPEPPEQRLISSSSSRICIAYAFVHRWQDSERLVSWITGDVASFQGAKFTVMLVVYDMNGEQPDVVLLARLGGESRQKKGKCIYSTKDGSFMLVLLSEFAFGAEHTNDACIKEDELRDLRSRGLEACAAGLLRQVGQGATTAVARSVREFEIGLVWASAHFTLS